MSTRIQPDCVSCSYRASDLLARPLEREGLEPRVAKLGSDVAHLATDMADVRATLRDIGKDLADTRLRVARLETKVDHLPGKGFIVSVVGTGLALLTAVLLLQSKLQHFADFASAQR